MCFWSWNAIFMFAMALPIRFIFSLLIIFVVFFIIIFTNGLSYFVSDNFVGEFIKIENKKLKSYNNNNNNNSNNNNNNDNNNKNNSPVKILNLENFQYVIDVKCTSDQDSSNTERKAVWIITSYAGDVSRRSALRHAYTDRELQLLGIRRIFLLGTLSQKEQVMTGITQSAIENEAERFHDIIQGNFVEAYKNLTYKHLMGIQWAVDRCRKKYSYIMKMDDDVVINLYEVLVLLQNNTNIIDNFLMGYLLEHMTPIRNSANKWYVTQEEYPGQTYPSFMSGWFYITNMLTAFKLLHQSKLYTTYFWIDDLFITGILREKAGIYKYKNIKEYFASDYRFLECCLKNDKNHTKYKCDFIVGPDGGNPSLLAIFKSYSEDCYKQNTCIWRPKHERLERTCILKSEDLILGIGTIEEDTT